jgi:hypothetical protein
MRWSALPMQRAHDFGSSLNRSRPDRECVQPRDGEKLTTSSSWAVPRRAAVALAIAGAAVCVGAGCNPTEYIAARGRRTIEREWSPTAPRCNLETAGNTLGAGTILYCAPSGTGHAEAPTWLYSGGIAYTITDSARSLTPEIRAMVGADSEAFRLAGLDRQRFQEQVAGMIAAQKKQNARR